VGGLHITDVFLDRPTNSMWIAGIMGCPLMPLPSFPTNHACAVLVPIRNQPDCPHQHSFDDPSFWQPQILPYQVFDGGFFGGLFDARDDMQVATDESGYPLVVVSVSGPSIYLSSAYGWGSPAECMPSATPPTLKILKRGDAPSATGRDFDYLAAVKPFPSSQYPQNTGIWARTGRLVNGNGDPNHRAESTVIRFTRTSDLSLIQLQ
jgi:hypothetical protein